MKLVSFNGKRKCKQAAPAMGSKHSTLNFQISTHRVLAWTLTLCMAFALLPVFPLTANATAENTNTTIDINTLTADIAEGTYANWQYVQSSGTIYVTDSVTISGTATRSTTLRLYVDGGVIANWDATLTSTATRALSVVTQIIHGSGSGTVNINGGTISASAAYSTALRNEGCVLNINNPAQILATGDNSSAVSTAYAMTIINGGTISVTGANSEAIYNYGISSSHGTTTINNGTISATGDGSAAINCSGDGGTVNINGGTINGAVTGGGTVNCKVTYDLNSGTGTTPTESNKTAGTTFTAAGIAGIAAPTGKQFKEWNTNADGTGISYAAGATVTMPASVLTLYAIWEDIPTNASISPTTANFDKYSPADIIVTLAPGSYTFSAIKNGGTTLTETTHYTKSGNTYTIKKEFLTTLDTGTQTITFDMSGGTDPTLTVTVSDTTPITYAVTYNLNGGTGTTPTESNKVAGATFAAASAAGITAPTGKQFKTWNTKADGIGTSYTPGATVTMPASVLILYAIWEDIPITTYAVKVNNGTGDGEYAEGAKVSITAGTPPSGEQFKNWTVNSGGVALVNPNSENTSFTMPANVVEVTANFENIPSPPPSEKAIEDIKNAEDGETVTITLPDGDTTLTKEVFEEIAGRDIIVEIEVGGVTWIIDGNDVPPDGLRDINLGVTVGVNTIPVAVINLVTGEKSSIQISLNHEGPFGFEMKLKIPLEKDNAGYYANLYYYNPDMQEMEYKDTAEIDSDGNVVLTFPSASDYAIVIDDKDHGKLPVQSPSFSGKSSPKPVPKPFTSTKTDPTEKYVDVLYMGLLWRNPDAGGFAFWTEQMKQGNLTAAEVAYHITFSEELKRHSLTNVQFLTKLYNGLLGRDPDAGGLDFWAALLSRGVTREALFNAFVASPEFAERCKALGLAV